MTKKSFLMNAAVAGLLGAAVMTVVPAHAADGAADAKGHCVGANACKGKGGCKQASNDCKGQNACKGQSFLKTTQAKCDKMAKKNKAITFEAASN